MTKTNVLIVEDEIIVAKNIEAMLKGLDYSVVGICISGEKAIKAVTDKKPDLILMDIVLRGEIDGIQTATEILKQIDIPIIFATSYSDDEIIKRAKETAPYGYIIKPFQKKELLAGIEIALERHALEQKIRENELLLNTTLQSISDGIITTDKKGNILYINNIVEVITGWSCEEVKGKLLKSIFQITHDDSNQDLCKLLENPSKIKRLTKIPPSTLIPKIGTTKIIDGSISPISETTGKTMGSVLVFRDITGAQKALKVQNALYNISNAVNSTDNIQELFQSIQKHLNEIIDTTNFYVALYDKESDTISLPYIIDEEDKFTSFPAGKTLTGYVIKHKKSILVDEKINKQMTEKGLIESVGSPSKIWLGVPLRIEKKVIGVVAVQSYEDENLYTKDDLEILEFVSGQLAIAISHKRAEDALKHRTQDLNERLKELNCLFKISDIVEDPEISMDMILNNSLEIIVQAWKYPDITCVKITWGDEIYETKNYQSTEWHLSKDIISYNKVLGFIEVGYLEERPEESIGPFLIEESNLLHAISDQLGRIAERKLAEDKLKYANKKLELLARTDPLTQLSNRRDVLEKIKYEKRRFGRSEKTFAIIICDIDDFKSVNDRFGHDAGDEVLKTLANIMCMNVRKQDTVSRWGGEEFLLLLPQTDIEGGIILAEKIRVKVNSKEFNLLGKKIHVSLTMGLSIYKENKTIDETINQADQALYMGKKLGKDCVKCETDLVK